MSNPVPTSHPGVTRRGTLNHKRVSSASRKAAPSENGTVSTNHSHPSSPPNQPSPVVERTVKNLKLSKALTIPEGNTVYDACKRMASRRVNAVLLTDSSALLSGIVTDKDIATRVIAEGLKPEQTLVSSIMTRNPIFVNSDSLAFEALQMMIHGKFRHLPVVENGEVIALLDITKCLYDAISRMEKIAEQGSAIAAVVEGVERQWGNNFNAPHAFIEILKERMFKPSLSTIIGENTKFALTSASDSVYVAARKMRDLRTNSVIVANGSKIEGILTSKDLLTRVMAQNLSPKLTSVEKVMTPNPDCATLETTILDALHIMHDGKFLHIPILDKDGSVAGCLDVLQISQAAISMVESGAQTDVAKTIMQSFWDSAIALEPVDDGDSRSEISGIVTSDGAEFGKSGYPSLPLGNSFTFKFEDLKGRVHRFNSGCESLEELVDSVQRRIGLSSNEKRATIMYEDDDGDKVLLTTDSDLISAVNYARTSGLKVIRLHLDFSDQGQQERSSQDFAPAKTKSLAALNAGIFAGALILTGIGVVIYLRRAKA